MSIVSLKIIFVKKQKQTRERPTQGRGATFILTEMVVFTLETDYSCETGIRLMIRNNPPDFIRQFRRTV